MECRFCEIARSATVAGYDAPLAANKEYFAIPSLGALVPGWVLICPREHRPNLRASFRDAELTSLRLRVSEMLTRKFTHPIRMFEHGAAEDCSATGCGVNHAHLHLVPLALPLFNAVSRSEDNLDWHRLPASAIPDATAREYLLYSDAGDAFDPSVHFAALDTPTSQYFRKIVAQQVGRSSEYDYRAHPNLRNVAATTAAFCA